MLPRIPEPHLPDSDRPDRPYRLMSTVRRRLRELRYSRRTEETYAHWIIRYVRFHERRHPKDMGADEIRHFLSSLAADEQLAGSTQNLALASLKFLYERVLFIPLFPVDGITPSKRPRRLPVVLAASEIRAILDRLSQPTNLCVRLMYGGCLRLHECTTLRVKDVDVARREIVVRGGKSERIAARPFQTLRSARWSVTLPAWPSRSGVIVAWAFGRRG